jgi:predicted aspartyl protease
MIFTFGRRHFRSPWRRRDRCARFDLTVPTLSGHPSGSAGVHTTQRAAYQAVHVPFRLQDGCILVHAHLAGKTVECVVDTGFNCVAWAEWLNVAARIMPGDGAIVDAAGQRIPATPALLSTLQIGHYKVRNVPGYAVKTGRHAERPTLFAERPVFLGNPAFQQIVLTADYQQQELILRPSAYDFSCQPRRKQDMVFEFAPCSGPGSATLPVVQGSIEGRTARILLDTGWTGPEIGLTEAFREAIRPSRTKEHTGHRSEKVGRQMLGQPAFLERIPDVSFSLGDQSNWHSQRPAMVIARIFPDVDAILGPDVLRDFRLTIDYPRRKALLAQAGTASCPRQQQ